MNFNGFKPYKVNRMGGSVDWDDSTQLPNGVAVLCKNARFLAESVLTRFGRKHALTYSAPLGGEPSGMGVLQVLGDNPQEVTLVFSDSGQLLRESPAGSGTLVPVTVPVTLPNGSQMHTALTYNSIFMAFSDLQKPTGIPIQFNGLTDEIAPISQNPVGMPWESGKIVVIGDLVRASDGRWWRCTKGGILGPEEPTWPLNGYFIGGAPVTVVQAVGAKAYGTVITKDSSQDVDGLNWNPPSKQYPWYSVITRVVDGVEQAITSVFGPFTINKSQRVVNPPPNENPYYNPPQLPTVFNDYTTIVLRIPVDITADAYRVYLGNGTELSDFTLSYDVVPTGAQQDIPLYDYRVFTAATGPNVIPPADDASEAQWVTAVVADSGGTQWEEWTPACTDKFPIPPKPTLVNGLEVSSIPAGKDVYVRVALTSLAEGQWSDAAILVNTPATAEAVFAHVRSVRVSSNVAYVALQELLSSDMISNLISKSVLFSDLITATFLNGNSYTITEVRTQFVQVGFNVYSWSVLLFDLTRANYPETTDTGTAITSVAGTPTIQLTFEDHSENPYSGPGGPRVPAWLSQLLRQPDVFFGVNYNVYVAAVNTGAAAPTQYALLGTFGLGQVPIISTIPAADITPPSSTRGGQIALKKSFVSMPSGLPNFFFGESGIRQVALMRRNRTGSLSPIAPDAVFAARFTAGGAQPVMFFPPGSANVSEHVAALTVAGARSAGPFFYIPTQDPEKPASSAIKSLSRLSNAVTAVLEDASALEPGMAVSIIDSETGDFGANGMDTFVGEFPLATVDIDTNTVTWPQDGDNITVIKAKLSHAVLTVQPVLPTVAPVDTVAISLNFYDEYLKNSSDATAQLTAMVVPSCMDICFSPSLRRMVYTTGLDSSHYFSNADDPANIDDPDGILSVESGNGKKTVCFRELPTGELLSIKEDGGYGITPSGVAVSEYTVSRRWKWTGFKLAGPRALDIGPDFLIMLTDAGLYRYIGGQCDPVGLEKSGTWKRMNKSALHNSWVVVDDEQKVVRIGVPLDGAAKCNAELILDYFHGWDAPIRINLTGDQLIPDRYGRRWSENDCPSRFGKLVKRQDQRQMMYGMTFGQRPAPVTLNIGLDTYSYTADGNNPAPTLPTEGNFYAQVAAVVNGADTNYSPVIGPLHIATAFTQGVPPTFSYTVPRLTFPALAPGQTGWNVYVGYSPTVLDQVTAIPIPDPQNPPATFLVKDTGVPGVPMTFPIFVDAETSDQYYDEGPAFSHGAWNRTGIDWQYLPSYASHPLGHILRHVGMVGQASGDGTLFVTPVTDDPEDGTYDQSINLIPGRNVHFAKSCRIDSEHLSWLFTNRAIVGSWASLQEATFYFRDLFSARRGG